MLARPTLKVGAQVERKGSVGDGSKSIDLKPIDLEKLHAALTLIIRGCTSLRDIVREQMPQLPENGRIPNMVRRLETFGCPVVEGAHQQDRARYLKLCLREDLNPDDAIAQRLMGLLAGIPISSALDHLSVRTRNGFVRLRLRTLLDLIFTSADDLLKLKYFGLPSLGETRKTLAELGLRLANE